MLGVPSDASEGLRVGTLEIGIPGEETADPAVRVRSGVVAYPSDSSYASAAQVTRDGSLRALVVIEGDDAPTEFRYPIDGATHLVRNPDGTVSVMQHELSVSVVASPWAVDANGSPVRTDFRIEGTALVQVVFHEGAAYPVVADPKFTWGWVTGTIYFNRAETATIAAAGWGATGMTSVCALVGVPGGPITVAALAASCFIFSASIVYAAGVANNSRPQKCLKIKVTPTVYGPWLDPGSHTDAAMCYGLRGFGSGIGSIVGR
jgi:hypothetical protein